MPSRLLHFILTYCFFASLLLGFSLSANVQDFGTHQDLFLGYDGDTLDLKAVDVDLDGDLDVIRLHEYWCTLYRQIGVGTNNFANPEALFQVESRTSDEASNYILTGDLSIEHSRLSPKPITRISQSSA